MLKKTIAALLCGAMLCSAAGAYKVNLYEAEDIFTQETIEQEKISDWAADEIELARAAGLITAHTGDYLTHNISRFQFAELAANFAEKATGKTIEAAPAATFTDTTDPAVLKACAAGIVNGMGEGRFAPDADLTREQLAAMLWRAIDYVQTTNDKLTFGGGGDLSAYSDAAKVSSWAKDAVTALAFNSIMKGTSATLLSPAANCTIEQAILLVYRTYVKF